MPNHLSRAQDLPVDVLRVMIKSIVKEQISPLYRNVCQLHHLKELLVMSSTWRQAALEYLWKQLKFTINVDTNKVSLSCPEWVKQKTLPHNAENWTKEIHVNVSMSGIVSGIARGLLVDFIGHNKCFPLTYKLIVEIKNFVIQSFDNNDIALANVLDFAKLLKTIAPAAMTVALSCSKGQLQSLAVNDNSSRNLGEEVLRTLANSLYANTNRASLDLLRVNIETLSTIDYIPQLSSLWLDCEKAPDVQASLVRRSAPTLRHLDINIEDANKLICDVNGKDVVYLDLEYLCMSSCNYSPSDAKAISSESVLFPVLKYLVLWSSYPFNDTVLFRGNSATLEYLNIGLDYKTIAMFNQGRLNDNKHKVLRTVLVRGGHNNVNQDLAPEDDVSRLLNNLMNSVKSLTVSSLRIARICVPVAEVDQGFQGIKVFEILLGRLSVFEVLRLLKALPNLVKFRGEINGPGPELENISSDKLPDHIVSTYGGTGKNIQIWSMNSFSAHYASSTVESILLLALACPKLRRIETKAITIQDYRSKITNALESGPYKKYAPQLGHLLNAVHTLYGSGCYR